MLSNYKMSDSKIILIPLANQDSYELTCHPWMNSTEIKFILDILYEKQDDIDLPNQGWEERLEDAMYKFVRGRKSNYDSRDYMCTWNCSVHSCWTLFTIYAKKDSTEDVWQENIEIQSDYALSRETCKLCDSIVKHNLKWHILE